MSKKEPSRFSKAARALLAVIILVVISAGATALFLDYSGMTQLGAAIAAARPPATPPPAAPIFTPLEPFTVTLDRGHRRRVLYVAITLRMQDQASATTIGTYMPETRDRTLRLLSEQDPDAVQDPAGRARLVSQLKEVLSAPYSPHPTGPRIRDVLFTAFVVQ